MSANTKIILVVIIFLLLLFAFVMPAAPQVLELNLTADTMDEESSERGHKSTCRMIHDTQSGSSCFFSGTGKTGSWLEEV